MKLLVKACEQLVLRTKHTHSHVGLAQMLIADVLFVRRMKREADNAIATTVRPQIYDDMHQYMQIYLLDRFTTTPHLSQIPPESLLLACDADLSDH